MKFTIGLPITKTNFLSDTLDSIGKQTHCDFELIIRNNGLNRDIKKEIKSICSDWLTHPNVVYMESAQQLKIADNFNEIVRKARGSYLTILSDDDILHSDFLREFDILADQYPNVDVFHCRTKIVSQNLEPILFSELCPEFESLPDFLYHVLIGKRYIFLSDFVVRTKALQNIGGFPAGLQGWGVDTLTWLLLGYNGIVYSPKALLNYRVNAVNFTNSTNTLIIKLEDLVCLRSEFEKIILSKEFQSQSEYPVEFLLLKNEERFRLNSKAVLSDICRANNLYVFYGYYRKYRKTHGFSTQLLNKLILKKLFLSNF